MNGHLNVIVGPGGTGKSTLLDAIFSGQEKPKRIKTITTRLSRKELVEGDNVPNKDDYFFLTVEQFNELEDDGKLIATKEHYIPIEGVVYYGILKEMLEDAIVNGGEYFIILDIQGAELLRNRYPDWVRIFYLTLPDGHERARRMLKRGDNPRNVVERLRRDSRDFGAYHHWNDVPITPSFYA